jgi:hypothetical protein
MSAPINSLPIYSRMGSPAGVAVSVVREVSKNTAVACIQPVDHISPGRLNCLISGSGRSGPLPVRVACDRGLYAMPPCRVSPCRHIAMSLLAHPDISAGLPSAASITCLTTAAGLGAVRQIVHGQDCPQAARGCALTPDDLECLQGLLMDGCMQTIHPYSLPAFCGVTAIMVRRHADGRIELAIALDSGRLLASPPSL